MRIIFSIILFCNFLISSNQIPGEKQDHPILIRGATIYTISSGILEGTDLLFENGKIVSIAKDISVPKNAEIIDAKGKHIFPGLISSGSTIGLQEIGAIRATRDYAEVGDVNPNVRSNVSYNPDSELIPVSRSNGVLLGLSVPRSGLISGTSSLMKFDGWTWEDATLKHPIGLHLFWPSMGVPKSEKSKKKKKNDPYSRVKSIQKIDDLFDRALAYSKLKEIGSSSFRHDLRLEGLLPVINGDISIFIHANEVRQIESAVHWSSRHGFDIVLVGGKDSWRVTELLKEKDIPVIYTHVQSLPMRRFEKFEQPFITPLQLFEAGIKFCISNSESPFQTPHLRNLPYHASKAFSYGLPYDIALRSITLSAAEILGVEEFVGSIDINKDATFFIADGDILDVRTNVLSAFIEGRKVDMSDRHKMFYSKYQKKYQHKGLMK